VTIRPNEVLSAGGFLVAKCIKVTIYTYRAKAIPVIRVILRNIQRSDLNLLAAYRKIPILGAPPMTTSR
jgi:hypothetical protein